MAGRPPKEKSFANMLNIAIKEETEDGKDKLRVVADQLVSMAMAGDMQAIKDAYGSIAAPTRIGTATTAVK